MVCLYIRVSWENPGTQQFPSKVFRYAFVELEVIARLPLFFIFFNHVIKPTRINCFITLNFLYKCLYFPVSFVTIEMSMTGFDSVAWNEIQHYDAIVYEKAAKHY